MLQTIKSHREEIIERWADRVRELPGARKLDEPQLINSIPELLDELVLAMEGGDCSRLEELSENHARKRYEESEQDIRQVVIEYQELRHTIFRICCENLPDRADPKRVAETLTLLDELLDKAVASAVEIFHGAEEKGRESLIGVLGHDLRNPLDTVMMATQLLESSDDLKASDHQVVTRLAHAAERMACLIRDLFDFARARIGRGLPIEPTPGDLGEISRSIFDDVRLAHPKRDMSFTASGNLEGVWDHSRVEQALTNLLDNALKHGQDPVRTTVEERHEGCLAIEVTNRGRMPTGSFRGTFDPMRNESRESNGMGLGMFIASEVARAHGGDIEVFSASDRVTVTVRLRRYPPPSELTGNETTIVDVPR